MGVLLSLIIGVHMILLTALANVITFIMLIGCLYIAFRISVLFLTSIKFSADIFKASYLDVTVKTWVRRPHLRKHIMRNSERKGIKEELTQAILKTHATIEEKRDLGV